MLPTSGEGGAGTCDLLFSSRTAHPTEPPRPATFVFSAPHFARLNILSVNWFITLHLTFIFVILMIVNKNVSSCFLFIFGSIGLSCVKDDLLNLQAAHYL